MKIGIPRALLYHSYKDLWLTFFENLGIETVVSPPTNKKIIRNGNFNTIDEACYSSKIYIGHVEYLLDKCDYIFVPRIENTGVKEEFCTRLFGIYDLVVNTFPEAKLLHANINYNFRKTEKDAFIAIGEALGKTSEESKIAYLQALDKAEKIRSEAIIKQQELLKSENLKVLIVSHSYNTFDAAIGESVLKFFKEQNIEVIFADIVDFKEAKQRAKEKYSRIYWRPSTELVGGLELYKEQIDGIVLISTFPCMPDSIVNELIIRTTNDKPILSLMFDELDASAGLMTRLESFTDILTSKKVGVKGVR
ncbi:MAG: acyl-CoA dehydratase activase-related protein [Erysipelotrichales bacterium]|nr:acyl-CoA dehydratase activase-related protein [Erysipelotrichales bacterium]